MSIRIPVDVLHRKSHGIAIPAYGNIRWADSIYFTFYLLSVCGYEQLARRNWE